MMEENVYGIVVNYRRGPRTQRNREYLLRFEGAKSPADASRLIGRKVAWPVKDRKVRGVVVSVHGGNGLVRAKFRKGLPGDALGTRVALVG